MWVTLLLRHWYWIVIASLSIALVVSMSLGRMWRAERDEKIAVIDSMHREAQAYRDKSNQISQETSDAFTTVVEQIKGKDTALNAARARFGSCNAAGGINPRRVFHNDAHGQAGSAEGTDAETAERVAVDRTFIDGCAIDAAMVLSWQDWARKNDLPVQ